MEVAGVIVDPSGKFRYVPNFGSSSVPAFTIGAGGGLTPVSASPFPVSSSPRSVQIDPGAKFAYVSTLSANEVEVFSIGATGTLNLAGKVRTRPQSTAIAFSGGTAPVTYTPTVAYVANYNANDITGYSVGARSGALSGISGSPFPAGSGASSVAIDPSGKFSYVANANSGNISAFTISASNGALTAVPGSPFPGGTAPSAVAVDPTGRFVYIANAGSRDVSGYTIDRISGALSPISGSPFQVAENPTHPPLYSTSHL